MSPGMSPLRDVAVVDSDTFAVAEQRGNVVVYTRTGINSFQANMPILQPLHGSKLLFVLEYSPILGVFTSGGGDYLAQRWTVTGEKLAPLEGHTNVVGSITTNSLGQTVTGGWDGSYRVWDNDSTSTVATVTGHEHGVEVLGLPTGEIVSGSASKSIFIDHADRLRKTIPNAHDHTIRKLIAHPLGFASAANDGFVKIWSNQGTLLVSFEASQSETKFIYGLAAIPDTGELVACGEDGAVSIFSAEGTLVQTISHPAAVRSVKVLPNGDIVTACTDKIARVFTRAAERTADSSELEEFNSYVEMAAKSNMQQLDTSGLPGEEALTQPGEKDGQVKIINHSSKGATVFSWEAASQSWKEIGQALGRKEGKKSELNGKMYDHVTDVYITETEKRQLGFNRDDDPMKVANDFCTLHGLPSEFRDQIINHVAPLTDHNARDARRQREKAEALQTRLYHVPSWSTGGFQLFADLKLKLMEDKLMKYNGQLQEAKNPAAIDDPQQSLNGLLVNISNKKAWHSATFSSQDRKAMGNLLRWPADKTLPVLDLFRCAMCHDSANRELIRDSSDWQPLLSLATESAKHQTLVLKSLTNWVSKRKKTAEESQATPSLAPSLVDLLINVLGHLCPSSTAKESLVESYVMFCYNVVVWLGRGRLLGLPLAPQIADSLIKLIAAAPRKEKTLFYALLTLASMAHQRPDTARTIQESHQAKIVAVLEACPPSTSLQQITSDVRQVFKL